VDKKILPENPNKIELREDFHFMTEAKSSFRRVKLDYMFFKTFITK
jgi:hypothetical protein